MPCAQHMYGLRTIMYAYNCNFKGPLLFQELLKYTSEDHPDYPHVVEAQQAMKEVAMLINEQKRRIENMGKIGCWQKTIDGWKVSSV